MAPVAISIVVVVIIIIGVVIVAVVIVVVVVRAAINGYPGIKPEAAEAMTMTKTAVIKPTMAKVAGEMAMAKPSMTAETVAKVGR